MAITVNGFGAGSGGGGGRRGEYHMKLIDADSSAVLSNITDASNNTPPVSSMQKLLDIPGPGRLLLLSPYGSTYQTSTVYPERTVRLRVAADDRIIYKACNAVSITEQTYDDGVPYVRSTGGTAPIVLVDPSFVLTNRHSYYGSGTNHDVLYVNTVLPVKKYIPWAKGKMRDDKDYFYFFMRTQLRMQYPGDVKDTSSYIHEIEDDNQTGVLDPNTSIFPGGLYFDDNLTIHAAYGCSEVNYQKNGIIVIYELFDD